MSNIHKKPLWRIYEKLAVLQSGFRDLRDKIEQLLWENEGEPRVEIYTFRCAASLESPYPNMEPPGFRAEAARRAKKEAVHQLAEQLMNYATVTEEDSYMGRTAVVQIKLGIVSQNRIRFHDRSGL